MRRLAAKAVAGAVVTATTATSSSSSSAHTHPGNPPAAAGLARMLEFRPVGDDDTGSSC
jgi:hypothetical protein